VLPALPAGCADLVFADPPFNIGYQYDVYNDRRTKADYLAWADRWLAAEIR
jgi:DNA modification methylase